MNMQGFVRHSLREYVSPRVELLKFNLRGRSVLGHFSAGEDLEDPVAGGNLIDYEEIPD